jgi:hypothetical protein
VDLLRQKHQAGRRFEPIELIEEGDHVAVQLHDGVYKVFTFAGDQLVLMQDCVDRDDALAQLATPAR